MKRLVVAGASILNLTAEEARQWFGEIDHTNRGEVSVHEFLSRFQQIANGYIPKPTDVEKYKSATGGVAVLLSVVVWWRDGFYDVV